MTDTFDDVPPGTVIPPPEIRKVIETTVGYILRNGMSFANRVREREDGNVRFAFLREGDAYNAFYQWRLAQHRTGRRTTEPTPEAEKKDTTAEGVADEKLRKPPKFEFSADLPPLSAQDLDIIKLTALYAAKNGRQFVTSLGHQEARNFQFDFLKPNHSLYPLFNAYVRQYKRVLTPDSYITQTIERGLKNKYDILRSARLRAEWASHKEDEDKKAAAAAERERIAYAEIDWHDFVVVETVEFSDQDKNIDLPPPVSLAQLQFASLEQKRSGSYMIAEAPPDYEPEYEPEYDPAPPAASAPIPPSALSRPDCQNQRESAANDSAKGNRKIRAAGTRRQHFKDQKEQMVVSPLTGELVTQSQYDEHMRISLLDPKWKEQRAVEASRQAGSNLPANEIDLNLKRMASARPDVFDAPEQELPQKKPRVAGPGRR